ncbi:MAG: DUF561 domain-containing protein [Candidatus Gastranaerophilaceae bacterium]|jgi:Fe-S-cluster-containing hydrogenase component 2
MLKNFFDNKKIFKLIVGAGNEDIETIKKLVSVYSKAGANVFDVRADRKIILEVSEMLEKIGQKDNFICASIGLGNDIHFKKAQITANCTVCKNCIPSCPTGAISCVENIITIQKQKCIGCQYCLKVCDKEAVSFYSTPADFEQTFFKISDLPVSYIEVHSDGTDEEIFRYFHFLKENFQGLKGICLSGNKISNLEKIEIIKKIKDIIYPQKLVVQADGTAMSGFDNEKETTIKALEASKLFVESIDDIYVIPSGGTNANTITLAREQKLDINGVAIGTYARKIVWDYLFSDEQKSVEIASVLVKNVKTKKRVKKY